MTPPAVRLPQVEPHVAATAVENLTPRLRKKLEEAVGRCAALPTTEEEGRVSVGWGEDTVVTLSPGKTGVVADPSAAVCSCLLAPRCLHLAAVLSACPVAETTSADIPVEEVTEPAPQDPPAVEAPQAETPQVRKLTSGQVAAAAELWAAGTAMLAAGVPGAGALLQAELLRAAHTARLAGLPRAEAAALRVVRGMRAARGRHEGHRLADLVSALGDLLLTSGRLAAADPDPALVGSARRAYRQGEGLRVYGVCREPVISATGYGGVVTHLLTEDGRWFSVADVRPGGSSRAKGAGTAAVALGSAALNHAQLARGGLLISGATVSPEGRLGSGKGVRATSVPGLSWTRGPLAELFSRPLAQAADLRLAEEAWREPRETEETNRPVGCDLVVVGSRGELLLARELSPEGRVLDGPLIRLMAANADPGLAHVANLRQLASRPGLRIRVLGRLDPDRAATLRPLAVGPVPGEGPTLRLPPEWQGHADLGYDRLSGSHLPSRESCAPDEPVEAPGPDPVTGSPLWRVRRLVELAVTGGRRALAESARGGDCLTQRAALRRAGFGTAAELVGALGAEADRRARDVFGRLTDTGGDRYAWAWLAASAHLAATERALVRASWQPDPRSPGSGEQVGQAQAVQLGGVP
ncbi:SWIM zinc finger family protein [Streptosporangium saharense]|uniref:SWIM-type domain-containing protein n=1 Tax=Streptosporangium saharense TaxID=1706840 RepID=A0A7W7QKR9_9ACTN|nr:SWIM zinc finger family protein [Streptosporangium saharense]MBB4915381.1 hypothetical protein [Streptosporangium saharense]